MVITTDFNIFADKYHNKQHLPDDMISMIMNINTKEIQTEIKDTHEMWNKPVMFEVRNYFMWLEQNHLFEDDDYDKETYETNYEELLGLIEWDTERRRDEEDEEDEEDGSG